MFLIRSNKEEPPQVIDYAMSRTEAFEMILNLTNTDNKIGRASCRERVLFEV